MSVQCFAEIADDVSEFSRSSVESVLKRLDNEIANRDDYISKHQHRIDSLENILKKDPQNLRLIEEIGELYTSFNNDSALVVYDKGIETARSMGNDSIANRFVMSRAAILPLAGFIYHSIKTFEGIDPKSLSTADKIHYYRCGRQMYSFIASYFHRFPKIEQQYQKLSSQAQDSLINIMPDNSPEWMLHKGESHYLRGEYGVSESLLHSLIHRLNSTDNLYARANHILADIHRMRGEKEDCIKHLALSAYSDIVGATREVTSLQELGQIMLQKNEINRAHNYLYTALKNSAECKAGMRMLAVAEAIPLIETVHQRELSYTQTFIYIIISLMGVSLAVLIVMIYLLRKKIRQLNQLKMHFEDANATKEEYISQFMNLCSVYMDKLKQFCNIANRKISTGKVDDFYQLTKSGKFIENQSKEFYDIFDNAFIHIYPGFVENVNNLLLPDQKIELAPGEILNTDLRILAFMRLGVTDTNRIAQILNYSVNTIYSYRNRLKNRAIDRDTFETAIMSI